MTSKHRFWYLGKEFANVHLDPMDLRALIGGESCTYVLKLAFLASTLLCIHSTDLYVCPLSDVSNKHT